MTRIPKVMNFFWSGGPLSWLRFLTIKSFVSLHPEWKVVLSTCPSCIEKTWHTPEVQDYGYYGGTCYFNRLSSLGVVIREWAPPILNLPPAHNSDIFEWDLLRTEGGFYSDLDILYTSKLNYDNLCQSDFVYCNANRMWAIGFLGSSPDNPIFDLIYKEAIKGYNIARYQGAGTDAVYRSVGMFEQHCTIDESIVQQLLASVSRSKKFFKMPQDCFYPVNWNQLDKLWVKTEKMPKETIGIHWFGGAPLSRQMNSLLTPDNVQSVPCTMTNAILANPLLVG